MFYQPGGLISNKSTFGKLSKPMTNSLEARKLQNEKG